MSMRNAFINKLQDLAREDDRIVFLTGDLGFSVIEKFQEEFPDRFYNVGIAEQNMLGIATGLAEAGMIPFVYSIAPFALLRPYEFIKNGAILHNLPIRIVAVGAGMEYGNLGFTHFLLEDIAVTRVYNNLHCYAPINNLSAENILEKTYDLKSPIYYRISKNNLALANQAVTTYDNVPIINFQTKQNSKTCLFAFAEITEEAIKASKDLGNMFDLYSILQYNPTPREEILKLLRSYDNVITVEAHYINNGIGSMVAEIIAENGLTCKLKRIAISDTQFDLLGDADFMYSKYNIDYKFIINTIKSL